MLRVRMLIIFALHLLFGSMVNHLFCATT